MEDFRRQFLSEAVEKLADLYRNIQSAETFSASLKRETFRVLHTVKGTAQTFDFGAASRLAHDLETLLSADGDGQNLLLEGIKLLQKSLSEEVFQIPVQFIEKLRAVVPDAKMILPANESNLSALPNEIYSQLSNREKMMIGAAIRDGKSLSVLEIGFQTANFAADLISFRERLNSSMEIIATFPGEMSDGGKIGFRFLAAGITAVEDFASDNSASISWSFAAAKPASGIGEVLRQIEQHGREVAAKLDKQIEIESQSDEIDFSPAELKLAFEVLLHLIRNAVDHAIERIGKVQIRIEKMENGFRLVVADDGRGIDLERLRTGAIKKNLIKAADVLTESETIDLIFQPELSTKTESNEISGRGIGLDAVKSAVEKSGGTMKVVTEQGKGTTFEIFLPQKENAPE